MKLPQRHHDGFTLLEMMVSLTLGTLILLVAAGVLGSSGSSYGNTSSGVAIGREGRALFHQLGADLASGIMVENSVMKTDRTGELAFVTLLSAAAQSDEGRIGDACAVSYCLVDLDVAGRVRRCLVRRVRESSETLAALRTGDTATIFTKKFSVEEPLAFDVVGFESQPKFSLESGEWQDWSDPERGPPDALEVTIILVRPGLAQRMRTAADWNVLAESVGKNRNPGLDFQSATLRFGNHARP